MKKLILLLMVSSLFTGCNKDNIDYPDGEVVVYLIDTYEKQAESSVIIESTIEIAPTPIINYSEIVSYNKQEHLFKLAESAIERIKALEMSVIGVPFAVYANDDLIYTAYFWPAISSAICDWVVADPIMMDYNNGLKVELGYPGLLEGMEIPDRRNNETLVGIFERDGKLE